MPVAVLLLLMLMFYIHNLYPAFNNDDSPETITAAITLGIQHPPGYPLYTMAGKIFYSIFRLPAAFGQNLFAAILAITALLYFYLLFISIKGTGAVFKITALAGVAILGLSGPFFSQAISAKGGIYMLNLIFLALCLRSFFLSDAGAGEKEFNLLYFFSGLSMANHWQSAVLYAPLLMVFTAFKNLKSGEWKPFLKAVLFFFIGLTSYLYLLIRARSGAVMDNGAPAGIKQLFEHILRSDYSGEFAPLTWPVIFFQAREFYRAVPASLFMMWPLAAAGLVMPFFGKAPAKKTWVILTGIFILFSVSVILLFRRFQDSQCYYLPPLFLAGLTACGALSSLLAMKKRLITAVLAIFTALSAAGQGYFSAERFSGRDNYLRYDYAMNIMKTAPSGSVYFAASAFDIMPLYYFNFVSVYKPDFKDVNSTFLAFAWGIKQFAEKFPPVEMTPGKPGLNTINAVRALSRSFPCFCGFDNTAAAKTGLKYTQAGITLLTRPYAGPDNSGPFFDVFRLYSIRGVYNRFFLMDTDNFRMISNYSGAESNYGNCLLGAGLTGRAIEAYTRALELPYNGSKAGMIGNIFRAYKRAGIKDTRGVMLKQAK